MNEMSENDFEKLLSVNQLRLLAAIARMTNGSSDSEDILQRVCVRMWEQRAEFRPDGSFFAWGKTIAYYEVMTWRASQRRENLLFSDDLVRLLGEETPSPDGPMKNRHLVYLEQCIQGLNAEMRQMLAWHYQGGESLAAIARRLGRPAHSVANTFYYLRGVLRGCVESKIQESKRTC